MNAHMKFASIVAGLTLAAVPALAALTPLKVERIHSRVGFTASTVLFDVDGRFEKYDVQLDGDPADAAHAKLLVTIDAASIDTDNDKRDEHLRGPDFLDVKRYPQIVFRGEEIRPGTNELVVTGTLELHGKKKALTIPFKSVKAKNGAGVASTAYKAKLPIKRADYDVGATSVAAKISLEDEVQLDLLIITQ